MGGVAAAHNADAATRSQLERLKREWRKEWEAEQAAQQRRDSQAAIESINAKLDKMVERRKQAEALKLEWDGEGVEE